MQPAFKTGDLVYQVLTPFIMQPKMECRLYKILDIKEWIDNDTDCKLLDWTGPPGFTYDIMGIDQPGVPTIRFTAHELELVKCCIKDYNP